ncbi:MAG: response regulator [Candidatus Omnitrophica bacterium]|nr:response regulator [Candidatus Omnitrophota bacterium]
MEKKEYNVKIVGVSLAVLYATWCLVFLQYINIPGFEEYTFLYGVLFGVLFVVSLAIVALKEWGRKMLIVINSVMLVFLAARYIPGVDLIPLGYVILSIIVLLYFTQPKIKRRFLSEKVGAWNKSILIVDDDETIIKTLRPILLSHGFSVLAAGSGEDGLQIINAQKPDLVLLDVILPGIKGREVCQRMKENPQTRDIPVVFLTAKDSLEDIQAEKGVGSVGHITKPVDMKMLVETIRNVLGADKASKKS